MVLLQTITGKITEIDNNKVKMIISMFGNDTVAEGKPKPKLSELVTLKRGKASLFVHLRTVKRTEWRKRT